MERRGGKAGAVLLRRLGPEFGTELGRGKIKAGAFAPALLVDLMMKKIGEGRLPVRGLLFLNSVPFGELKWFVVFFPCAKVRTLFDPFAEKSDFILGPLGGFAFWGEVIFVIEREIDDLNQAAVSGFAGHDELGAIFAFCGREGFSIGEDEATFGFDHLSWGIGAFVNRAMALDTTGFHEGVDLLLEIDFVLGGGVQSRDDESREGCNESVCSHDLKYAGRNGFSHKCARSSISNWGNLHFWDGCTRAPRLSGDGTCWAWYHYGDSISDATRLDLPDLRSQM